MKEITVIVKGGTDTGKSTISRMIYDILSANTVDTQLIEHDGQVVESYAVADILEHLRKELKVTIVTEQETRASLDS